MRRTQAWLGALGLVVLTVVSGCSGTIDAADSTAGSKREANAAPENVVVPDLAGMDAAAAEAALTAAKLVGAGSGEGTVSAQDPAAGASIATGSTVTYTLTVPEPTGTRDDPFPAGTTLSGTGATGADEATVLLGAATWNADEQVAAENQFNDPAPEGSVYVIVPVTVTNVGSTDAITPWVAFTITYVAPDGRSFDSASAVIPNDLYSVGDLYEGGTGTGNIAYVIPLDAQGGTWAVEYNWSDPVFVVAN